MKGLTLHKVPLLRQSFQIEITLHNYSKYSELLPNYALLFHTIIYSSEHVGALRVGGFM